MKRPLFWPYLLIAVTALGAYGNSFGGPFIFDDHLHIANNPRIRNLWPPWEIIAGTPRPVVYFSLALNYFISGLHAWSYHAVNLAVHVAAAWLLFGIVHRTLQGAPLRDRFGPSSHLFALATALLWVAHPLQTESVTYIIQRAESLMGLFFLLALYSVIRGAGSPHRDRWAAAAVLSCAMGMGCKPVMVSAPLVILLYDRVFIASSWRQIFHQRRNLYAGMAATWVLLGGLLIFSPHELLNSRAGFWSSKECAPIEYALTQPEVILRYLKLSFWPHPLVLDYRWPLARDWGSILLPSLLIGGLIGSTLWALRCHPRVGFVGAWFFLTLAPTSSFIPIADPAAEHRIYLPLAAVTVVIVFCGYKILLRFFPLQARFRRILAIGLLTLGVMTLGALTFRRNQDYLSETAIWRATVEKRPENPRAHNNLGLILIEQRKSSEAMRVFTEGLQLHPTYAPMHSHLGRLLAEEGKLGEAITHLTIALRLQPDSPYAHNDLGVALAEQGNLAEAESRFVGAVRLKPDFKEALQNLELAEERMGRRSASH